MYSRDAPMAIRIVSSGRRSLARTSASDARLASAVANTTITAPSKMSIAWRKSPTSASCSASTRTASLRAYCHGELLPERGADRSQLRLCLISIDASSQAAEDPQKVHRAPEVPKRIAVGRQWRHDIDVSKRQRKLRGQHANDDERLAVDPHGLADDVGGPAILALPEAIAQEHHRRRIRAIVAVIQQAPDRRRYAKRSNALADIRAPWSRSVMPSPATLALQFAYAARPDSVRVWLR